MGRDLRDPEQIGHGLLNRWDKDTLASHWYDKHREQYESVVDVVDVGPLDRYPR